jgi:TetR/AcrR family fatty acid metabolism transcriptional regulator
MTVHSGERLAGEKRDRILAAAEQVFARHGFFAAKVADIARAAGVADGTIYLYFKSKDDLLISLFESRMERVNALLDARITQTKGNRERLEAFVRTYLAMIAEQPAVAEVLTVELRQSSKFMKADANPRFGELLRILGAVIEGGQRAGEFDATIPAPMAARMVFGILDELATAWLLGSERGGAERAKAKKPARSFDISGAADWVLALVCRGLCTPAAPTPTRSR